MKYLAFALLLFSCTILNAQTKSFRLSGNVISEESNEPLEAATIYLEKIKDTTLVTYTISDKNGDFFIEDRVSEDSLNLFISYVGHQTLQRGVKIDQPEINLGSLKMQVGETLGEIVIRSRAPITIKKDTLEFNVKSFKTKKDATVEDLLKELPGVEVDDEGNITVNGKSVNKILVNGKPFFGDDPTITTRNLTKEIINKVQIVDTKTDAEAFAGEDGDQENKTINLTIDEDKNKGVFGRVAGGVGTDDRYEFAGFFNRFDNDQRLSVLAGGNNINSPGFSFGEIRKMFGGGSNIYVSSNGSFGIDGRRFGGGQGIVRSNTAGANYVDDLGEKLSIATDYFYAQSDSEDSGTVQRENILPDSRFFTNSSSRSNIDTDNHVLNIRFDVKVDSTWLINIKPSFSFGNSERRSDREDDSRTEDNVLTNMSTVSAFDQSTTRDFKNDLDVTKKFGTNGMSLRFNMTNEFNSRRDDDFLNSETEVFGDNPESVVRNQFTDGEFNLNSFYAQLTYKYPLIAEKLFLNAKYSLRDDTRETINATFDFDAATQSFTNFNTDLSTNFSYTNRRSTPALGINYRSEKISGNIEIGFVTRTLENSDRLRPQVSFEQEFDAIEINSYFNYRFSPKASIYGNYRRNNNPPEISQLQPFQDVSDPLNVTIGNPNLKPANRQSVYIGYNGYDFQKGTGLSIYGNFEAVSDQVIPRTTVDENFVRTTTFANVNGNNQGYLGANYSKKVQLDSIRDVKISLGLFANKSKNVNFNNEVLYASRTNSIGPSLRLTFNWKKVLEFSPNYRLNVSRNTYEDDIFEDQDFISHNIGVRTATFLPKKFEWRNDINYQYNPNVAPGFQRSAWFWNSTLAYSILKDQGTVTLKVYDLLNQNTNARRTATANYIQDSQSLVLQQYFMLNFSWKFNSLGKKGESDDADVFFFD